MKRSEINNYLESAKQFFKRMNFLLPPWAYWNPEDWQDKRHACSEVFSNMLGWDITDFGSNDFLKKGLLLFTIRNGNSTKDTKPYAEKIMIAREDQVTPMHFHWNKMEDIINRGGCDLVLELYNSTKDEKLSNDDVVVKIDGVQKKCKAGEKVILTPGESIFMPQNLYHKFYGRKGTGHVLTGEVSMVNDDSTDNRFYSPAGRFPDIIEDEKPLHLLVSDYANYI